MAHSRLVLCRTLDFTEQERFTLGLLRPHLDAAFRRMAQPAALTARQHDVLGLAARGRTNKEIAAILSVSPGTVRKHLDNIYARLGAPNRTAAAHTLSVLDWWTLGDSNS